MPPPGGRQFNLSPDLDGEARLVTPGFGALYNDTPRGGPLPSNPVEMDQTLLAFRIPRGRPDRTKFE